MKDKLRKNHHKGMYYRIRNFLTTVVLFATLGLLVGIPTYFSVTSKSKAHADSEQEEVVEDNDNQKEQELLHY